MSTVKGYPTPQGGDVLLLVKINIVSHIILFNNFYRESLTIYNYKTTPFGAGYHRC